MLTDITARTVTDRQASSPVAMPNEAIVAGQCSQADAWFPTDASGMKAVQLDQFRHDERYHREIARLTVKERLTHMALHFAKYSGYLAEGRSGEDLRRLVVDAFVIGVSCANVLNIRIHDHLAERPEPDGDVLAFGRTLAIAAGRMASACERLDHLEAFAYRQTIQDAVLEILAATIGLARQRDWDILSDVRERLARVKEKSIFHGDL